MTSLKDHLNAAPFTLALSSGFFGFFAHCGMTMALEAAGVTPSKFTGASAGAIVAAAWAHGVAPKEMKPILMELKKRDFWDPGFGLGLLKGQKLETMMNEIIGTRAQQADLGISVFDVLSRKTKSFASGDVGRRVRASCAVPMMFHPVWIEGRLYWDGGILDKMAVHGLPSNERVFAHYLDRRDPRAFYERERDLQSVTETRQLLVLRDLPLVGPNALDKGLAALDTAFERTSRALEMEHVPLRIL